ncbi:hypothetical protein DFAR_1030013 [Desulfarculales bacterium]
MYDLPLNFLEWQSVFQGNGGPGRETQLNNQEQNLKACKLLYDWLNSHPKGQPAGVTP